jgi:pilus assembly protein CpaB
MSRRLGLLLALGGLAIAFVGILFVALILRASLAPPAPATQVPSVTIPVLVARRGLPVRSLLAASDVNVVNMPVEYAPLTAVSDLDTAVGKILMIPMAPGEIVMAHHLAEPTNIGQNLPFIIEDDQVVMAFPANDLMSQLNVLKSGDRVDILVSLPVSVLPEEAGVLASEAAQTAEGQAEERLFTFSAMQHVTLQAFVVEVMQTRTAGSGAASGSATTGAAAPGATPRPTATPGPSDIRSYAVLLALSPQDALVLKHLKDAGGIMDLVLRSPTSNQTFDLDPVSPEYLKDRYELVPQP